jgi:hypothetical protein
MKIFSKDKIIHKTKLPLFPFGNANEYPFLEDHILQASTLRKDRSFLQTNPSLEHFLFSILRYEPKIFKSKTNKATIVQYTSNIFVGGNDTSSGGKVIATSGFKISTQHSRYP